MSLECLGALEIGAAGDNMVSAYAAAVTPSLADVRAGKGTLRRGMKGDPVRHIQQRVGAEIDGDFGSDTEDKVKAFQKKVGLDADGVVDKDTLVFLEDVYNQLSKSDVHVIHEKAPAPKASAPVRPKDNTWLLILLASLGAGAVAYGVSRK